MDQLRMEQTKYGFNFGSAEVTRCASDEKAGWVSIDVTTKKTRVHVVCLKGGKIHLQVFDNKSKKWADVGLALTQPQTNEKNPM